MTKEREKLNYDHLKDMFDKLKQPDPKGLILLPSLLNLEGFDVIEMPANEIRLKLIKRPETTFTTTLCDHENISFRKVRVNLFLFNLTMLYQVCHDCKKLIKDHKYWKIELK